jgi:fibronectin type 3 domain-containing protein
MTAAAFGGQVSVSWDAVEGAEGYAVYRKQEGKHWERIESVDGLFCTDATAQSGATYVYTVVPFLTENGQVYYGKFDYNGAEIQLP